MQKVFYSIDDSAELTLTRYNHNQDGYHCFFLEEQSILQILREFPFETPLEVTKVSSQRHRIAKRTEVIMASKTVGELLAQTVPLVESGVLPCDVFAIVVNYKIGVIGRNDYSVELRSADLIGLKHLLTRVYVRQQYSEDIIDKIINQPELYHQLERPNIIVSSRDTNDD
jgi:hypothetical protein